MKENSNYKKIVKTNVIKNKKKKRIGIIVAVLSIFLVIWVSLKIFQGIIILTNTSLYVDDVGNIVNVVNDYKNGQVDSSYTSILLERHIHSMENQKDIIKPQLDNLPFRIGEYWGLLDDSIDQVSLIQKAILNDSSVSEINDSLLIFADKSTSYINTGLKMVFYQDFNNDTDYSLENIEN